MPQEPSEVVVVVVGGDPLPPGAVAAAPPGARVIAADSGLDHALAAGLEPDLVVGDLDSVSAAGLSWAREHGVTIQDHPPDKDKTDTELALAAAIAAPIRGGRVREVLLLGGGGDRLDHSLAAITALGHPGLAVCGSVSARWGTALVEVLHGPRERRFDLAPGTTFSLLALHGPCHGVRVDGARWPLDGTQIEPGSSLGVSNVAATAPVTVAVGDGVLTVVVPDHCCAEQVTS